ncbi:hypothetical protein IWT25_02217 [Secundilactobacillus pentosiphilus]|uniref:Integrase n=1 Tax=Secundilactobacillus pentosiphilus TaxID=1714682 RepID=A0A1Z5IYH4_9LACO|nr:hypothetical protein [Secundilactobacillus pentosiphilus]GAX06870.1 hypothetical protein IWT25_02217 [Secundilactobacillus pentosiphilus]
MNEMSTADNSLFETFLSVEELSDANLTEAKQIFQNFCDQGIFLDCRFEDTKWNSTDEYSRVGLNFNFNQLAYNRSYRSLFGLSYQGFVNYVKVYVTYTLGKNVLKTLQSAVNDLKRLIRTDLADLIDGAADIKFSVPSLCIDFLALLPTTEDNDDFEQLLEVLDTYISINHQNNVKQQRQLAQFDSYFMFNDILNDYWAGEIAENTRMFFYPLYLWWQVTGVIPLRPKEFILTRRDCLNKTDGKYYLTLQRNNLKGSKKNVAYKLSKDYYPVTYQIPDKLAKEFIRYLAFTEKFEHTDINTLFVSDTHYKHWNQRKHSNSRFLTYINMNTIMRYFFHDVIEGKYGLKTVYNSANSHLGKNEISYLHLGDTRHLALINIMAEGGTPVTAMLLAGHDNIEMSAHYYSNITNLIECQTYRQYRLITKGEVRYEVSTKKAPIATKSVFEKLANGGRCYSEKYKQGDMTDCLGAVGKSGEIGYCPTCPFYRRPGHNYYSSDAYYKHRIEDDCKLLETAVHQVRTGKGDTEDIGEALLKLQSSSFTYQKYYQEKVANQEKEGRNVWDEKN